MKPNTENNIKNEIELIVNLYKQNKLNEALNLSNELMIKNNNIPFVLNLNGLINLSLEKWQNAISVFKKAINCDSNFVEAYNNLGVAYIHLGEHENAIKNYHKAIEIKKDYANAYNNLATHYDDIGNYNEAVKFYVNALNYNSNHILAQNNLIHLMNFYNPNQFEENSIVKANNEIKKINVKFSFNNDSSNFDLSAYFKKCNNIVKKVLKNVNYIDSQIHRRNEYNLNCERHKKAFDKYNIIPKYCFSCIKVQIKLNKVSELIKLFFIFDKLELPNDNIRKCFVELRPKIKGAYKGLIYCSSMEDAKEVFKIINSYLTKILNSGYELDIKRGCTEFDIAYPGYKDAKNLNKVKYNENWMKKEEMIDQEIKNGSQKGKKFFSRSLNGVNLGDILIMNNWLCYAKLTGDKSYENISKEFIDSAYIHNEVKNRNI
ncbi:tetratricopeptide repeat protein [Candidatus Pelagibacter sp.]|nr:tetratricopeptide repeat protein [Candidatus Pelagibacter sp.]